MVRSRTQVVALLAATAGLLVAAAPAYAGSWMNSYNFGSGVSLKGDLYTPTTPASPPAVLVAIHMCTGHSSTVHGWFDSYADKQGFYIIAPDAGKNCFDSSATRDGDKAAIVAMVNYLLMNKGADKTRVFAAGMSSGGCMTNTLLAIYPDVFAGGSAMPGYPAGAWPAGDTQCMLCGSAPSSSQLNTDWAGKATSVFKWSGTYPCSQQWVGGGDEYHFNAWLPAVAKQFQTLAKLGDGMSATGRSGWMRTVYKDSAGNIRLETNLGPSSQMHDLETVSPTLYGDVITFLGLDKAAGACGMDTTTTTGSGGGTGMGGGTVGGGGRMGGNGGRPGNGGSSGSGATTGASGGSGVMTGGTSGGSGGITGTGGAASTGGSGGATTGSGGATTGGGSGGKTSSGGTTGTGGMLASSGGATGSGGKASSGGSDGSGSGGASSSSGGSGSGESGGGGGCSVAGGAQAGTVAMLLFAALGLVLRRRARSRR